MGNEEDDQQAGYEDGAAGGPGAPTPLSALEVSFPVSTLLVKCVGSGLTLIQGVAGLTARDIKLIVDGGFNTVEAVAYTLVPSC